MLITMLGTHRVSEDGFATKRLEKGKTYDIAHTAACSLIHRGFACNAEESTGNENLDRCLDEICQKFGRMQRDLVELGDNLDAVMRCIRPRHSGISAADPEVDAVNNALH